MVQTPFFPPRDNWQPGAQDGRLGLAMRSASVHGRDLTVVHALRECSGVPVKEYALFAILDNGHQRLYSSSQAVQNQVDFKPVWDELNRSAGRGHEGMWTVNQEIDSETSFDDRKYSTADGRHRRHTQRSSRSDASDEYGGSKKKRSRTSVYRRGSDDMPLSVITSTKTQQLRIGDEEEVKRFYLGRFKDMQQNACKILGKAFVKLVEPKKQTHHPYTGGDAGRPLYWPFGQPGTPEYVRHKEPDHLYKNERVYLLTHILSLIVLPNEEQLECLAHLRITVKKLEETTMESMNNWFNDKDHPENMEKKKYLKEIFKIAKQQERYKSGQIDGTAFCNVMFGDRPVEDSSDDEHEDTPTDDPQEHIIPSHLSTEMAPPEEIVSPLMSNLKSDVETSSIFQTTARRPGPVRFGSQAHLDDHQTNFNDPSLFTRGMNLGFQNHVQPDTQRGYGSPVYQNTSPLYAGWNAQTQGMVSSGGAQAGYYTTSSPSATGPSSGQYHLPALSTPVTQQSMLPPLPTNPFELPTSRQFDMGPGIGMQLRTGSHGHPHINHHGFSDYMNNGTAFGQPDENQHHVHQSEQR